MPARTGASRHAQEHSSCITLTPEKQREILWQALLAKNTNSAAEAEAEAVGSRTWPSYDEVLGNLSEADYASTLTCPFDTHAVESCPNKTLCPYGVVCCAEIELFALPDNNSGCSTQQPYTGLLRPGTKSASILRLSSAMKPPSLAIKSTVGRALLYTTGQKIRTAKLFPCAAIKVFRQDHKSGNLLFGGSKVGQREADFFAHCLCTSMTEQMPRLVKPLVSKFWTYSDYPLSLGVSDFCNCTADGEHIANDELNFPFAVILRPCFAPTLGGDSSSGQGDYVDYFDRFLDQALAIPTGTLLFDVFACPDPHDVPDASKLQRIGRVTSSSQMILSSPSDGLFFRHQKKEEDYSLRPDWSDALRKEVTINDGNTTGAIGTLVGWKLFEQHIAVGSFVDFENPHGCDWT